MAMAVPLSLGQCQSALAPPQQVIVGPIPHERVAPAPHHEEKQKVLRGLDDVGNQLDDLKKRLQDKTTGQPENQ